MKAEKKTDPVEKNSNVLDVFTNNAGGPPKTPPTGAPKQRVITQAELQQLLANQQAFEAAAARKNVKPAVEFSRIEDQILVRKEVTADQEIETKFDFYTQLVSKKTTLFINGTPQIQLHPDIPFSKYTVPHVIERIRKDLIDMGGKPNALKKTKAEFDSEKEAGQKGSAGYKFGQPGK